jgi:hypothetical protein
VADPRVAIATVGGGSGPRLSQLVERPEEGDVAAPRQATRNWHGTLLIKAGIPVKMVSERLGHGNPVFTIDTYQHVLPGMQAEAARIFESLIVPEASTGSVR